MINRFNINTFNADKEISLYPVRSYDNDKNKWITLYIPLTLSEVECMRALISNIENSMMASAWTPHNIFKKKIRKALTSIGYDYYSNMLHGKTVKHKKCNIDDYKVLTEYFYINKRRMM